MSIILRTNHLTKAYTQWKYEWQRIASWFLPYFKPCVYQKVLDDVSIELKAGEALGIIGQNGAGKSTLLKLITGIVHPTQGVVQIEGKIAAILELGMGFNLEMTGRQNAYHVGCLMGYGHDEIEKVIPEIEAFAEIGNYFDLPMRTYSSGMQMRVAFSVATSIKPDLLIVDEALSVGDSYFQHKSFHRIREFKDSGAAILFVSHNMKDVRLLCNRVILLDGGRILKEGNPDEVVDYYNAFMAQKNDHITVLHDTIKQHRNNKGWVTTQSGTREASVTSIVLMDAKTKEEVKAAYVDQSLEFNIQVAIHAPLPQLVIGCCIRNKHGLIVWGTNTWHTGQVQYDLISGDIINLSLKFLCHLGPDSYSVSLAVHSSDTHLENNYEWNENILIFDVINTSKPVFVGVNWIDADISIAREARTVV